MSRVFVSYRVKDDTFGAEAIYEILVQRFGSDQVFRDVVSLQPGEHYPSAILDALVRSDVLLAIVGSGWLTLTDDTGVRLIDRDRDWVRREIATALTHDIPIIPVLLEGSPQPTVEQLPRNISRLALIQALRVSHQSFGEDIQRLADRLTALAPGLATSSHVHGSSRQLLETERLGRYEPPAPTVPPPAQLLADIGEFTGRRAQLARLRTLLDGNSHHHGPVVVAGPPGVGKTALVIHVAHELSGRFPDGQLYANLRGHDARLRPTTSGILTWFLRALGVPTKDVPAEQDEQSALFRSLLSDRRTLIVLDNAVSAAQIQPLLPNSPTCRVLVTSRDSLGELIATDGAQLLLLDVLDPADAEELLARMVGQRNRTAEEPDSATEITRLCGYLPMAVCIAAAKLRTRPTWRLAQVAERLANERRRLSELTVGDVGVRASFALSYESLEPSHAVAFRRLGLIAGGEFTVDAAAALLGTPVEDTETLLEDLFDTHMVDTVSQPGRYRFHDLLRLYAQQCAYEADTSGEREGAIRRLLTWYLIKAETADEFLMGNPANRTRQPDELITDRGRALEWLEAERLNLVAAIQQAVDHQWDDLACQLAHALYGFFNLRKYWIDAQSAYLVALAAADRSGNRRARARMLHGLGRVHLDLWRLDEARQLFAEALAIHRDCHDRRGEAHMINDLGLVHAYDRRRDQAIAHFQEARFLLSELGDRHGEANALANLGSAYLDMTRLNEAPHWRQREPGHDMSTVDQQPAADRVQAMLYYQRSLDIRQEIGDRHGEGESLNGLGNAKRRLRQFDEAIRCYESALAICRETGDQYGRGIILSNIGVALTDQQQFAHATEQYRQALDIYRKLGHRSSQAVILSNLGAVFAGRRQWQEATAYYRQSLSLFQSLQDQFSETQTLARIAEIETYQNPGDAQVRAVG